VKLRRSIELRRAYRLERADWQHRGWPSAVFGNATTSSHLIVRTLRKEAYGIREMMERFGWTQSRTSEDFGKSREWVSRRIELLGLDAGIQNQTMTRVINPAQARRIAQATKDHQPAIVDKAVWEELS
jgi:hypothetical protein